MATTIELRKIRLLNFKGIRDLELSFTGERTDIFGRNGSGKTTIFDAFSWTLFGKDSQGRSAFDVKTYDENGKFIERIPHEVTVELLIDGDKTTLRRCLVEKWAKRPGSLEEYLKGNETEYYYNDVPMKEFEYRKRIDEICSEQLFRLITNPFFFTSQKSDAQRKMLFSLVGGITDEDVLAVNPDLSGIVDMLTGKSIEDLKKEVANKKRVIKERVESIPARIDEQKRVISTATEDWVALEQEYNSKKAEFTKAKEELTSVKARNTEQGNAHNELLRKKMVLKTQKYDAEQKAKELLLSDYNKRFADYLNRNCDMKNMRSEIAISERNLAEYRASLDSLRAKRVKLLDQYYEAQKMEFKFNEDTCICPTCKRKLEEEDIESVKAAALLEFNQNKERIIAENKSKGLIVKNDLMQLSASISDSEEKLLALKEKLASMTELEAPVKPTITEDDLLKNEEYASVCVQLDEIEKQISEFKFDDDSASESLSAKVSKLYEESLSLGTKLKGKQQIEDANVRIAELESQYTTAQQELCDMEKVEYDILQFSKAKVSMIEDQINGMFKLVKFKLFDTLINGNEVECCEATVDGVPYNSRSASEKINIGLDIINAICKKNDVYAPIFIDNKETISHIIPVDSQLITLSVDESNNIPTIL